MISGNMGWGIIGYCVSVGRLYACDFYGKRNYELNPDTLVAINTVTSQGTEPSGIGGTKI